MREVLRIIKPALPSRNSVQVLNNILLKGGVVTACNLELMISAPVDSKLEALLPPKIIEIAEAVGDFDMTLDGEKLNVSAGKRNFTLHVDTGAEDYPETFHIADRFGIEPAGFIDGLASVVFAVSTEEHRPSFTGVLIEGGESIKLTASDTYRLAQAEVTATTPEFRILVKPTILKELIRLKPDKLEMGFTNSAVTFNADGVLLSARLLDEKYPDVTSIVPKQEDATTKVSPAVGGLSAPLLEAIRSALLMVDTKNRAVTVSVTDGLLTVKASGQVGNMQEEIAVNTEGDDIELYLNAGYIADVLKYEGITIDFYGDGKPVVIRRPGYKYLYLCLPIKKMG